MPTGRVPTFVYAEDSLLRAGMLAQLRHRAELRLLDGHDAGQAKVVVVVTGKVTETDLVAVRRYQHAGAAIVLIVEDVSTHSLGTLIEAGVVGIVPRSKASPEQVVSAVWSAAAGEGSMPKPLLGQLLEQMRQLQRQVLAPRGFTFAGLTDREIEVLRLLAEGLDTAEVAERMRFSERTVKSALFGVTSRLQLRNRTHAVAWALRQGLI